MVCDKVLEPPSQIFVVPRKYPLKSFYVFEVGKRSFEAKRKRQSRSLRYHGGEELVQRLCLSLLLLRHPYVHRQHVLV